MLDRLNTTTEMAAGGSDDQIYIPYENALQIMGARYVTLYVFTSTSGETAAQAKAIIDGMLYDHFQGDEDAYYTTTMEEQANLINAMMGVVMGVLVAIAAISLLVGGIGIMNIMLVTVTERTREIGIRRSLGAQRSSIVAQFLIESGMLCGMGGIVGIIFGTIGSLALGKILFQMTIFPATWVTLAAFGLSVALGVLFGSYPAAKASKLQPVEALRAD